jgi:hypothetical protein
MKHIFIEFIGILVIYLVLRGIADFSEADHSGMFLLGWLGGVLAMGFLREVELRRRRSDAGWQR